MLVLLNMSRAELSATEQFATAVVSSGCTPSGGSADGQVTTNVAREREQRLLCQLPTLAAVVHPRHSLASFATQTDP